MNKTDSQIAKIIRLFADMDESEEVFKTHPSEIHKIRMVEAYDAYVKAVKKLSPDLDPLGEELQTLLVVGESLFSQIYNLATKS